MLYAAMSTDTANFPEAVLKTITKPFTAAATSISSWVDNTLDKLVNADKYKKENEELRARLSEMYTDIMDKDKLTEENKQLKEILGIVAEHDDFKFSPPCSIIAKDAASIAGNFTINKGSNSGIKKGDPVITDVGLVGVISETAPTYSRVRTILSTEVQIGVITVSGAVMGIIENDILYSANKQSLMTNIEKDSGIKAGDMVVTLGGNMYPAGLIIGTVAEVFPDDSGLLLNAVIEPAVDIYKVSEMFVIISFEGQGVTP